MTLFLWTSQLQQQQSAYPPDCGVHPTKTKSISTTSRHGFANDMIIMPRGVSHKDFIAALPPKSTWHTSVTTLPNERVLIIGDTHGCADELRELLTLHRSPNTRVIFVGDVVNKGPKSIECIRIAREIGALAVRGNHDHASLCAAIARDNDKTIAPEYAWVDAMTAADRDYLARMPFTISLPAYNAIVVHAGLVPGVALDDQQWCDMIKMRDLVQDTPDLSWGDRTRDQASSMGVAPPVTSPEKVLTDAELPTTPTTAPVWRALSKSNATSVPWAKQWPTEVSRNGDTNTKFLTQATPTDATRQSVPHVYFGHDAKRMLQLCPNATGIDTGCLYGGELTAVELPSKQRFVVHAHEQYVDPLRTKTAMGSGGTWWYHVFGASFIRHVLAQPLLSTLLLLHVGMARRRMH